MKIKLITAIALLTLTGAGAANALVTPEQSLPTPTPVPSIQTPAEPVLPSDGSPVIDTTQKQAAPEPAPGIIIPQPAPPKQVQLGATINQLADGWIRVSYNSMGKPCSGLNLEIGGNDWSNKAIYDACSMTVDVSPANYACKGATEVWIQMSQNGTIVAGKYVVPVTCPK